MAASIVAFNLLKLLLKSNNVVSIVTLCYFSSILRAEQDILESIHVLSLYENTHNSLYPRRDAMDGQIGLQTNYGTCLLYTSPSPRDS